jgi:ribosome-associated toxin RatA of RatAB toxin-antitoxin module
MLLRVALLAGCALSVQAARAAASDDVEVESMRRGTAVEIRAIATVDASYATIWGTLTDYDHLAEFVPGMKRSRVVAREAGAELVEQEGEASFLFLHFPIRVTVLATPRPPLAIDVRLVKGNLRQLAGGYRLEKLGERRYALRWVGLVEPESMPPLLGELVMRSNLKHQFTGMVREIERREAAAR